MVLTSTEQLFIERPLYKCFLCNNHFTLNRSSHPEVFCKNGVLKNFAKFTGKHLCQGLFLIKLQALDPDISVFLSILRNF